MARKPLQTFDVFVGNLPNDANERNVGKFFTPYGEIAGIVVKETSKVPLPYNKYAFVKFLCEPDAEKAVQELDKTNVQGSNIVVKRADDRKDQKKKSFGEGGGRRGFRQSDSGSQDSYQGEWTCPKPECANINFSRRTACNLCNAPRPEGNISSDNTDVGGVISASGSNIEHEHDTVLITHVETPITLWIQVVSDENTKKIFNITEQLGQLCPAAQPVTGQPESGKVYACLFSEDCMWYRCQVKQNLGTDKFKIQYVDYGNTEEVALSSLVELPAGVANVKGLACKIQLHNTRAKDRSDKQGILFLKSLTDNKMAQLVRTRPLADGSGYYGDLFVDNYSLSDSMIQAGYCQSRPAMGKQQTRQQQNDISMFSDVPGPQQMGPSFPGGITKPQRDPNMISSLGQPPPIIGPPPGQPPIGQAHIPNMGFSMQINQPDHGREKKLQIQLTKKNQELERMRNEKDAANMQAEYMRSKVKTLQEEFAASASRLQEDTMSKRVNTAVALAGVVRNLREQFPTNKMSCLLEDAIAFCMDNEQIDNSKCGSLADVSTSLARYKAAQDEISKCREQSELQDLIDARDDCRRDLYKSLSTCLEEMEQLPLETRSKQVQETQFKLKTTYSEYLNIEVHDVPNIENLAPGFSTWKVKKDIEFKDIRTATDFCEGALQTALVQVRERISVHTSSKTEKSDVDIDDLFKTYSHALQREINVTDLVHGKDANLVATVIASVRKELQNESATLENISVLHQDFSTRKRIIEPWLNECPTFTDLHENRKHIRSLKSKLRHIQADKLDLEESGDEGELDDIREEEERIRTQLQAALILSDNLLNEVATLADSNFPELILQYPDFGIDNYLVYKGLVKANRDIDHYCLQSGFRPGVHISSFSGEPVLLQEFHIGDSEHCSKDEFITQLVCYNGDTNMVQAVFFSKSDRLAYVQSHWDGGQLIESVVDSKELRSEQLHKICLRLAEQVVEIHARGCIHGEITPQTVILKEDDSVMLMYPDFSKQTSDRINKRHVAEGGLVFQTPELQYTSPDVLGQAADVYNLVLLMFWLYCPNHRPTSLPNSGPGAKDLTPNMQQLFDAVLSGKTATQIHAQQVHKLLQESMLEQKVHSQFVPVLAPEPVLVLAPAVSAPEPVIVSAPAVIRGKDEPMEIGVFRAEDYITVTDIPLQQDRSVNSALDTDNSWTTESSLSGTSGSRGDSPLDNTVLEVKSCSDTLQSVSLNMVTSDSSHIQISGSAADRTVENSAISTTSYTDSTDHTSPVLHDKELMTQRSGPTEKGAACEVTETLADNTLKMLLHDNRTILTSSDTRQAKPTLKQLLNIVKKTNTV